MKKKLVNFALLIVSTMVTLLVGERLSRIIFEPIDVLSPKLVPHQILGHRITPYSGGHDSLGFRNRDVPTQVDIGVLGSLKNHTDEEILSKV